MVDSALVRGLGLGVFKQSSFRYAICVVLLVGLINAAETPQKFEAGKKAKVTGVIQSRNGDLVTIKVKKSAATAIINLTDNTKVEREKDFRLRRADMDVRRWCLG